jgi:hypothetical protein
MEKRRTAVLGMPRLVREWRKVSWTIPDDKCFVYDILTFSRRAHASGPSSPGKDMQYDGYHAINICTRLYQYESKKQNQRSIFDELSKFPFACRQDQRLKPLELDGIITLKAYKTAISELRQRGKRIAE